MRFCVDCREPVTTFEPIIVDLIVPRIQSYSSFVG